MNWKRLSEFFQEDGGFSAMRLMFIFVVTSVVGVWIFMSVRTKTLQPLDNGVVTFTLGVAACKTVQRFGEK